MTADLKIYEEPVPHYRWKDIQETLTDRGKDAFQKWMAGQTGCMSPEGDLGVYKWDYERWLLQGKQTKQGTDWD